jgi:hypothetical protein
LRWDDPSPFWEFATSLRFEADDPIRNYLEPRMAGDPPADSYYDDDGRARIGYIYLTVKRDLTDRPSGTCEDLVEFSFGTPGSSMSVLFFESESIRRTFTDLLVSCRGVYGVFDQEDPATLFWWRGRQMDVGLPTAEMTLAQIEEYVGLDPATAPDQPTRAREPVPTFRADEVFATARHLRRTTGGTDFGANHWLLALLDTDPGLGLGVDLSPGLGPVGGSAAAAELRRRLENGDAGESITEDQVRARAAARARGRGADQVTSRDIAGAVADAAPGVVLLPEVTAPTVKPSPDHENEQLDYPDPSFWTPRNSTCDPWWRRTLDRALMELPSNSGGQRTVPFLAAVGLVALTVLAALLVVLALLL